MTYSKQTAGVFDETKLKRQPQQLANEYNSFSSDIWYENGEREDDLGATSTCAPTRATVPSLVDDKAFWAAVPLSDEDCAAARRQQLENEIQIQIQQISQNQVIADPLVEGDVFRQQAAATGKLVALENTPDGELDSFDPTLDVADPQDDTVAYSRFTASIITLPAWAGAPDAIYGWHCTLEVRAGSEGDGSEGRVLIVDDPSSDSGGVLSFTQDVDDPRLWIFESRDGGKWGTPNIPAKIQLLWGNGSLFVSPIVTVNGRGDRQGVPVRYWVASGGSD